MTAQSQEVAEAMMSAANDIGLNPSAEASEVNADWTPDQVPPAMKKLDDAPDFAAIAATFGGPAAGGRGIVMDQPVAAEIPKPAPRGFHKDGSPRDAMESAEDCAEGFCAICK